MKSRKLHIFLQEIWAFVNEISGLHGGLPTLDPLLCAYTLQICSCTRVHAGCGSVLPFLSHNLHLPRFRPTKLRINSPSAPALQNERDMVITPSQPWFLMQNTAYTPAFSSGYLTIQLHAWLSLKIPSPCSGHATMFWDKGPVCGPALWLKCLLSQFSSHLKY